MFHTASGSATFYGTPTIYITEKAARYMRCLVDAVTTEVGWLMVTHQDEKGDFILSECIVPRQDCHAATTELTGDGLAELANEVMEADMANGITDPNDPKFRYNHLNAWFHSHGSMSVGPSGQDETQMADFCRQYGDAYDVWIRGIVNKSGDIHLTVYFKAGNCWKAIANCPCEIKYESTESMADEVRKVVQERVSRLHSGTYTSPYNSRTRGTTHRGVSYTPTTIGNTKTKKGGSRLIVRDRRRVS